MSESEDREKVSALCGSIQQRSHNCRQWDITPPALSFVLLLEFSTKVPLPLNHKEPTHNLNKNQVTIGSLQVALFTFIIVSCKKISAKLCPVFLPEAARYCGEDLQPGQGRPHPVLLPHMFRAGAKHSSPLFSASRRPCPRRRWWAWTSPCRPCPT